MKSTLRKKTDRVLATISTYEKTAEDYYSCSDNLSRVKSFLDFFIARAPGKKVLEIGCGPGRDAKYLFQNGLTVTGIDLAKNFLRISRRVAPKAQFKLMDMRSLKFASESFDGLWVMASFLHVPKVHAPETLAGFARVLRPGGLMYISVKVGNGQKSIKKARYGGGIKFFAFYNPAEIKQLIKNAGFKIVKQTLDNNRFGDPFINFFAVKI